MSQHNPSDAQLASAVRRDLPSVRSDLERLIRIPSVSADPAAAPHLRASADEVAGLLRQAGLPEVEVLSVPDGPPAVLASRPAPPGAPTVLLYAHHDVQPAGDPAGWDSDPFEPAERDGRLYGRGAADDKAGIAVHLAALRAHGSELAVGVRVLIEGEEEIGSPTLSSLLEAHQDRIAADVVVLADSANPAPDVPALTTSLRGGVNVVVELRALRHGVHSGLYGGAVPDALTGLCRLLATLHDERGDMAVAGVHRGPADPPGPSGEQQAGEPQAGEPQAGKQQLTEEQLRAESSLLDGVELIGTGSLTQRLWARPAITVIGIDAPPVRSASNVLIPAARALVSMRVAPGDDVRRACEALVSHLESHAPWGMQVSVQPGAAVAPFSARAGGRAYRAAHTAFARAWGRPAVDIGVGGSIGFVIAFAEFVPDAEILITGVEDPDTRAHGANESLHLALFERACLGEALLLRELACTG